MKTKALAFKSMFKDTMRLLTVALLTGITVFSLGQAIGYAAPPPAPTDCMDNVNCACPVKDENCGFDKATTKYDLDCNNDGKVDNGCNIVTKYVNPIITVLSGVVGVVVVIAIIIAGIQYAGSAGDPQKAMAAKIRIRNAIIALLMLMFMYAFLRFVIPGTNLIKS
jgi:hypothetical protein